MGVDWESRLSGPFWALLAVTEVGFPGNSYCHAIIRLPLMASRCLRFCFEIGFLVEEAARKHPVPCPVVHTYTTLFSFIRAWTLLKMPAWQGRYDLQPKVPSAGPWRLPRASIQKGDTSALARPEGLLLVPCPVFLMKAKEGHNETTCSLPGMPRDICLKYSLPGSRVRNGAYARELVARGFRARNSSRRLPSHAE